MFRDVEGAPQKLPSPNEPFLPRDVFRGIGALVPERIAASTRLSMTAKVCYGHLVRRAGKNARCWPSYRDIARSIGIGERHAMRALKELNEVNLIKPIARRDKTTRQTSNEYEFIWGPILQGEGDKYDTLPPDKSAAARVTDMTPTGVTDMTPLELSQRNHHQVKNIKGKKPWSESNPKGCSAPALNGSPSQNPASDDDSKGTAYASAKDELKAIYQDKYGTAIRVNDLDSIESALGAAGATWEAFVAEVREHAWDRITNPVGFLKHFAKNFRLKTQAASAPVTADEAAVRDYKCSKCFSKTPGEGLRWEAGKALPCECANPEYVARQRARGIFNPINGDGNEQELDCARKHESSMSPAEATTE
jgi:hypothetical protein